MGRLYDQMKRDLELRNFSPHTRRTYLACVRRFALYFHRSPAELGDPEIREYLHYLIKERKVSQGAVTQAYGALKFFYETTLKRDWEGFRIPKGKGGRRLPTVLSQQEVEALFGAIKMTIYSAGLRISEALHLKLSDIDSQRMTIRVEHGKGNKDRYTLLGKRNLDILREYWKKYRPRDWLFCNPSRKGPLSTNALRELLACPAHRGRVDDGQELLDVVDQEAEEEVLVPVLQCRQADVLLERILLPRDICVDAPFLLLHRAHGVRQEPFQPEVLPFLSVEGCPLRVHGMA